MNSKFDLRERIRNKETVVVHVENKEMAASIDEVCAIPQLDVVFVGPADLCQSMGKPGQPGDPAVVAAIEGVVKKTLERGKAAGIYCSSLEAAKKYADMGVSYIAYGVDAVMFGGFLKNLRGEIGSMFA